MSAFNQQSISEMVGDIYQSVFDLTQLSKVLERIKQELHCNSFLLRMQNTGDHSVNFNLSSGYDAQWNRAYQKYFHRVDPYPEALKKLPVGMRGADFLLTNAFLKSEYYNDFLKPQKKYHCIGGHILRNSSNFILLGFQRHRDEQAFQEDDLFLLQRVEPHLKRVLLLNQQHSELLSLQRIEEQVLNAINHGVIVFGEKLQVLYMNKAANDMAKGDFGLKISPFGPTTAYPDETQRLNAMLRQGLQLATGRGDLPQNTMQISPVREGLQPLNAVVLPLSPENRKIGLLQSTPKVILMLSTPNRPSPSAAKNHLLKDLFGLTTAEAHLARELASGRNLGEIADHKGISRHTVRSQLKTVFAKTGTNRQSELVRLVMTLPDDT
ncbi:MAG: hypothetical protein HQL79_06365 [Magnetococcales bacterium]|nr:hypothetical protein [Magnetococcales bacterium]